jgi:malonyl CoA-acyl carrier protein transacylase
MTTRIFVFPGQGSQKPGMGAELFGRFPEQVALADAELGFSTEELCVHDPSRKLDQTEFTQPALFVVNALSFLERLAESGPMPHFVAGHSLGEYDALFAAGVFNFQTGVKLVKQRASLMGQASGGAMAAVIGLTTNEIREALTSAGLNSIDIANLNSPKQVVISGPEQDLGSSQTALEQAGAQLFKRLNVSAAFHSRYMADAQQKFAVFLDQFEFAPPRIPVISNVTAHPYDPQQIKENLIQQITHPVRWTESIQWLLRQPVPEFHEVGPGKVLSGLIRRIRADSGPGSGIQRDQAATPS